MDFQKFVNQNVRTELDQNTTKQATLFDQSTRSFFLLFNLYFKEPDYWMNVFIVIKIKKLAL